MNTAFLMEIMLLAPVVFTFTMHNKICVQWLGICSASQNGFCRLKQKSNCLILTSELLVQCSDFTIMLCTWCSLGMINTESSALSLQAYSFTQRDAIHHFKVLWKYSLVKLYLWSPNTYIYIRISRLLLIAFLYYYWMKWEHVMWKQSLVVIDTLRIILHSAVLLSSIKHLRALQRFVLIQCHSSFLDMPESSFQLKVSNKLSVQFLVSTKWQTDRRRNKWGTKEEFIHRECLQYRREVQNYTKFKSHLVIIKPYISWSCNNSRSEKLILSTPDNWQTNHLSGEPWDTFRVVDLLILPWEDMRKIWKSQCCAAKDDMIE